MQRALRPSIGLERQFLVRPSSLPKLASSVAVRADAQHNCRLRAPNRAPRVLTAVRSHPGSSPAHLAKSTPYFEIHDPSSDRANIRGFSALRLLCCCSWGAATFFHWERQMGDPSDWLAAEDPAESQSPASIGVRYEELSSSYVRGGYATLTSQS